MTSKLTNTRIERRHMLGLAAGVAIAAATDPVMAQKAPTKGGAQPAAAAQPASGPHAELAASARACVAAGDACLKHCIALLNKGDTSLVDCMKTVTAMMPICRALERYAEIDAKRLKELVVLANAVNTDCESECRKHASHHDTCKACADACKACLDVSKKYGA